MTLIERIEKLEMTVKLLTATIGVAVALSEEDELTEAEGRYRRTEELEEEDVPTERERTQSRWFQHLRNQYKQS